jgi:hypothetical protein
MKRIKVHNVDEAPALKLIASFLLALATIPALAAGPSTPQEWQRMYDACVEGASAVSKQKGLGPGFAPQVCACVSENLQKIPASELNSKYQTIQNTCIQSSLKNASPSYASEWPPDAITKSAAECHKSPPSDVPATSMDAYCTCAVDLTAKNIRRREFLLLDSAVRTKGMQNLDAQEKSILAKWLEARHYCSLKNARQ